MAELKLRIKEKLRASIEAAAQEAGGSMNSEMARRLEASFRNDAVLERLDQIGAAYALVKDGAITHPEFEFKMTTGRFGEVICKLPDGPSAAGVFDIGELLLQAAVNTKGDAREELAIMLERVLRYCRPEK